VIMGLYRIDEAGRLQGVSVEVSRDGWKDGRLEGWECGA
jgi:hypothetical protein